MTEQKLGPFSDLPINDPTNPAHRLAKDLQRGLITPDDVAEDVATVLRSAAAPSSDTGKMGGDGDLDANDLVSRLRGEPGDCAFCGRDPYHYVDNGVGMERVAVTCCDEGIALYQHGDGVLSRQVQLHTEAADEIERLRALSAHVSRGEGEAVAFCCPEHLTRIKRQAEARGEASSTIYGYPTGTYRTPLYTHPSDPSATERMREALRAFLQWGQQQCPCENDLPDPCPLCDASVANLEGCKAVDKKFPPRLLAQARAALGEA